jgi:molybdate transport system permease protein
MTHLLAPLLLSLQVALSATVLVTVVGLPLAFVMARARWPGRSVVQALLTLPLVLPPTVVGYGLIVLLGRRGWIGSWLHENLDYSVMFHWHGAVLASAVVAFPLLYLPARAAFASVEREYEDIARLAGANLAQVFWHVSLPLNARTLAAGALLAFCRALGEFGATIMVLGDVADQQTLPLVIYNHHASLDGQNIVTAAVLLLVLMSLIVTWLYNRMWMRDRS